MFVKTPAILLSRQAIPYFDYPVRCFTNKNWYSVWPFINRVPESADDLVCLVHLKNGQSREEVNEFKKVKHEREKTWQYNSGKII